MSEKLPTTVVTPEFVSSYLNILAPQETPSGKLKYSVSMVFDQKENLDEMRKAAENACINKWGADKTKWPKGLRSPFRNGNDKDKPDDLYKDRIFVNASANEDRKPGLVDASLQPILNADAVYSGMICRAQINMFAYSQAGNNGVAAGLNHVMKVRDGDRLGGGESAESAFSAFKAEGTNDNNGGLMF